MEEEGGQRDDERCQRDDGRMMERRMMDRRMVVNGMVDRWMMAKANGETDRGRGEVDTEE